MYCRDTSLPVAVDLVSVRRLNKSNSKKKKKKPLSMPPQGHSAALMGLGPTPVPTWFVLLSGLCI